MNHRITAALAFVAGVSACASSAIKEAPASSSSQAAKQVATTCGAEQFVACTSGEDCARRGGHLIRAKACFDHAADACAALSCAHGCNIHHGVPKDVLCAPNASSSSHMTRCGGIANWACPEQARCELPPGFDAIGTCVPTGG